MAWNSLFERSAAGAAAAIMAHRFTQGHDFRMKSGLDEERAEDIISHGKDNAGKKVMPSGMATPTAVLVATAS